MRRLDDLLISAWRARQASPGASGQGELKTIGAISEALDSNNIPLHEFISEAARLAVRQEAGRPSRLVRDGLDFDLNASRSGKELSFTQGSSVEWQLEPAKVRRAVVSANRQLELVHDLSTLYGIELFETLGLRNLSSFVGEIGVRELARQYATQLVRNPNQDGYPDLCALTPESNTYLSGIQDSHGQTASDKQFWSPYPYPGIEVKATCGNVPPSSRSPKPAIGTARLPTLVSAEWKAHHQETRVLLGFFWDFVDRLPTLLAAFFRNDLDTREGEANRDWASIVKPRAGGGRTTSVSIMRRGKNSDEGVKKMGDGWLVLPRNPNFRRLIGAVFGIKSHDALL